MADQVLDFLYFKNEVSIFLQKNVKKIKASKTTYTKEEGEVWDKLLGLNRGKVLRGSLVCYGFTLNKRIKKLPKDVLLVAAALELSHLALLIHDDIIDDSAQRRGQLALHKQYPRAGKELALCAGDMALMFAFGLIGKLNSCENAELITKKLSEELARVCAGQMQDIRLSVPNNKPGKAQIMQLMRCKTAGYSIALPLQLGAILAGCEEEVQNSLYKFGLAAGTIYQIQDDELGIFGNTTSIGKPVGDDIRQAKQTLLYYYLQEAVSPKITERLNSIFGNPGASELDIDYVRTEMVRHNVSASIRNDIKRLERQAWAETAALELDKYEKQGLNRLIKFCSDRLA